MVWPARVVDQGVAVETLLQLQHLVQREMLLDEHELLLDRELHQDKLGDETTHCHGRTPRFVAVEPRPSSN